jgi:Type III flagellar switch regulator (C-ring) FliN C-term
MMASGVLTGGLRRFRAQALAAATREPAIDEAGRSLRSLARGVVLRAHEIVDACSTASHGPVELRGYTDSPVIVDRAWRFNYDRREMFCVLSDTSERLLLSWIVGDRHCVQTLSPIERNIVGELMRRLLSVAARGATLEMHEEPRIRPQERSWRCNVQLGAADQEHATIELFTEFIPPETTMLPRHPDVRDVSVQLRATLPNITCILSDVWEWRSGSLLRLQCSDRDISVGLYAGGRRVGLAQLGTIFGNRAVKLITLNANVRR